MPGRYYVEKTRTRSGRRYLPMTDEVYESLRTIVRNRPDLEKEPEDDGYSGFLVIDKKQQPKVALHIENEMRRAMKKCRKLHPDIYGKCRYGCEEPAVPDGAFGRRGHTEHLHPFQL